MSEVRVGLSKRRVRTSEYWDWLAVALFLLVPVDLLTSLAAAAVFGLGAEGNPVMAWVLSQSVVVVVAVNLAVVVASAVSFAGVVETLELTPPPYARYLALAVEVWLGSLVAVGLAVFANNLTVIVHGVSLL